jgi:acetyl esterase/lipase
MVSKSTHVYKTVGSLHIMLDIYTRDADVSSNRYTSNTPVILFFHGGGIVSHDRRLLPPHFVQLALIRGWPLVSADYRLFPQANGLEVLEDVKDAYDFVREKLPNILNAEAGPMRNVIVAGCSAGVLSIMLHRRGQSLTASRRISHVPGRPSSQTPTFSTPSLLWARKFRR